MLPVCLLVCSAFLGSLVNYLRATSTVTSIKSRSYVVVCTTVPLWALHASRRRYWLPPTPLCKPKTSILSSLHKLRPTSVLYTGPHAWNFLKMCGSQHL